MDDEPNTKLKITRCETGATIGDLKQAGRNMTQQAEGNAKSGLCNQMVWGKEFLGIC